MVRQVYWWLRLALRSARRVLRASGSRRAGHRVSDGARGGTGRAAARVLALLAVASALAACAGAKAAFATITWGENGPDEYYAQVWPHEWSVNGRYSATAEFLGFDWGNLSDSQKSTILSGDGGDNAFTRLASVDYVRNIFYEGYKDVGNVPDVLSYLWERFRSGIFGGEIWACCATSGMYNDAREYYQNAIGAVTDNNNGIQADGNNITIIMKPSYSIYTLGTPDVKYYEYNGNKYVLYEPVPSGYLPSGNFLINFTLKLSNYPDAKAYLSDYDLIIYCSPTSVNRMQYSLLLLPKGKYTLSQNQKTITGTNSSGNYKYNNYSIEIEKGNNIYYAKVTGEVSYTVTSGNANVPLISLSLNKTIYLQSGAVGLFNNGAVNAGYGYSVGGTIELPNPPENPSPPNLSDPEQPTYTPTETPTVPSEPSVPDITWPTITAPTGDYDSLLREIISLQRQQIDYMVDLINALAEHCQHLQQRMVDVAGDMIEQLDEIVAINFEALMRYMKECSDYIVDYVGLDLTNFKQVVERWLKLIYSKLGGGQARPDPTVDGPGFWDWLTKQFHDFFDGLIDGAGDAVGGLADALGDLTQFFPFSIPWDLLAIFALLAHDPVIPVFDLPMPVPSVIDQSGMVLVHVDCTAWDGVARTVRSLELVFFAWYLARMVPSLLNMVKIGDGW